MTITGSIARSAKRQYLSYSEGDFELFRPAGATRCTDGGEIWHGGVCHMPNLIPNRCKYKGTGPQKPIILLKCLLNLGILTPATAQAYALRDFYDICSGCVSC